MSVITINGPIGCGAIEVGKLVSQKASLSSVSYTHLRAHET